MDERKYEDLEQRLARIEAALARLEASIAAPHEIANELPGLVAVATDTFDRAVKALAADGIDVDERVRAVGRLAATITDPQALTALDEVLAHHGALLRVVRSGLLEPKTLATMTKLAEALAQASEGAPAIGLFGALRAAGTPHVQKALGFAVTLASAFGRALEETPRQLKEGSR